LYSVPIAILGGLIGLDSAEFRLPFAVLFLCGLLHSLRRRRKESLILYLWILSGIGGFTLLPNKDLRYTVPVLPAVAIISLSWVGNLRLGKRWASVTTASESDPLKVMTSRPLAYAKWAGITAVTIWSLLGFFNAQWPRSAEPSAADGAHLRWLGLRVNYYQFDRRPVADDWGIYSIVNTVADSWSPVPDPLDSTLPPDSPVELSITKEERPTLGVIVNLPYLNPSSIALYSRLLTRKKAAQPLVLVEWIVSEARLSRLDKCDYLLVRPGLENADRVSPVELEVEKLIRSNPERFTKVDKFPLPRSDCEAVIYRLHKKISTVSYTGR
jgi:hypothetical protein